MNSRLPKHKVGLRRLKNEAAKADFVPFKARFQPPAYVRAWLNAAVILLLMATVARAAGSLTVAFPSAATYTVWVQNSVGATVVQPMTVTGVRTLILPAPTVTAGDTVFVMDGASGKVAEKTAPAGGTLPVSPGDFHALKTARGAWAKSLLWGLLLLVLAVAAALLFARRRPPPAVPAHDAAPVQDDLETLEDGRFPHLFGTQGLAAGTMFALVRPVMTVGRDGDRDLVLTEETVSRHHARLTRGPNGQTVLTDEGSANGTLVNGRRIKQAVLSPGDEIQIGDNFFLFQK